MSRVIGAVVNPSVSPSRVWSIREAAGQIFADNWADPYFSSVTFGCHFEGANGSTAFLDVKGATLFTYLAPTIKTDASRFGASSGNFTGSGYVYANDNAGYEFDGAFTIDGWFSNSSGSLDTSQPILLGKGIPGASSYWFMQLTQNQLYWCCKNPSGVDFYYNINYGKSIVGGWHHFEIGRDSANLYMFIDGVLLVAASLTTYPGLAGTLGQNTDVLGIGARSGCYNQFTGYLDDIRITKGVCRHTGSFTPPKYPFRDF